MKTKSALIFAGCVLLLVCSSGCNPIGAYLAYDLLADVDDGRFSLIYSVADLFWQKTG